MNDLLELLRIPSVSGHSVHAVDVERAQQWAVNFIVGAGGSAVIRDGVVDGLFLPSHGGEAPRVLCYGHLDVQPPEPLELWESAPFEPEVRDGWLYARGVADDKGGVWMLLTAAAELTRAGNLGVNLRFLLDGEEEIGGVKVAELLLAEAGAPDACIIFDTGMLGPRRPVFNLATRGTAYFRIDVKTGEKDLHSGVFGGAALNATHALIRSITAVLPNAGRLPDQLRVGTRRPDASEIASWSGLEPGCDVLAAQGARPADAAAAEEFRLRTWLEPALDVHALSAGFGGVMKTIVPATASAMLSMRLAPGQTVDTLAPAIECLLRDAIPSGAELSVQLLAACNPGATDAHADAIRLAADAFERVIGVRPAFTRSGGSLPIMASLGARGVPTILTGFDLPNGNIHAPNERMRVDHLELGVAAARETLRSMNEIKL